MLKSSGAMGAATVVSRVLGLLREVAYASFMGNGAVAGAFFFAFMVPNLFRRLLGEGALTAAFIPIFKEKERTEGKEAMWHAANAVISGLLISATAITLLVVVAISAVLTWVPLAGENRLILELLRIMFPYMLLVCLAATFIGMLNARGYFFIPTLGAALLNVVMIASVFLLAPRMGDTLERQIFGLAIGVLLAGIAQAAFQIPALRREGYRYRWVNPWGDPTVQVVIRKMLPASVGVAAFQINVLLTGLLAVGVYVPIVANFNFAVRLMEFPQGVFGVSLATFLLPTLSGMAAERDYAAFRSTLRQGLDYLLFVNLIASVFLVVLAEPVVRLLFEWGNFGSDGTARVFVTLACLAPGLVAFSSVNIIARAFYALGDTTTPMRISVFCLAVNLLFAVLLIHPYRAAGLGLANTVTAFLNLGLLLFALRKKLGQLELAPLRSTLIKIVPAAILAGAIASWFSSMWEASLGHGNLPLRLGAVFVPAIPAVLFYWLATWWAQVPAARDLATLVLRKR